MKKWTFITLTVVFLALTLIVPSAFAADSPVQSVPHTDKRLRRGIEIHLYDALDEDENGELQAVVPIEEVSILAYADKDHLAQEQQDQFTEYYKTAVTSAESSDINLVYGFWIDIPDVYENLLRTKESYVDETGNRVIDGEYLKLAISKPGTGVTCTVNGKEMDVIDNNEATVILKLTEIGAVAVFAEEVYETDPDFTYEESIPNVIPDSFIELLIDDVPAIAICGNLDDEQQTAVSTIDVTFLSFEHISQLESADQVLFQQAYENVRNRETDQSLRYFFWLDLPDHYALKLSDDPEKGEYLRLIFNIPGENPVVTVNDQQMEVELIGNSTYAVKLTATGAVVVYSDPVDGELAVPTVDVTSTEKISAIAAASDDDFWYRG